MAETFVLGAAEHLLIKIASLALDKVALAWGLETNLKKLQELLTSVKDVLLDAEEKQAQNHELLNWLRKLKNFCYDAEDVLDELEYEGLRKKVVKQYGNAKIKVRHFFSSSNPLLFRLKMGHKVKELMERLDEIADHRSNFHLAELVDYRQVGFRSREMTDSLLHMSNVIGRDGDKENILEFLLHLKEGETVSVIPIVGLGGMGKTTLAKMLYNDESVKEHFDLRIWVCVSEIFEKKQIMVSMIKDLTEQNCSDLDPNQLQRRIRENLNSKRFLLVLDDVWSDDRGKWIEFQELLLVGAIGSKVIVTTRNDSVANTVRTIPSHHLKGLSHEKCMSLFKKLAFREGEEKSHPHLIKIGDDIVKKCGGIPLAVKTMGTLLYSKIDEHYWKFIRDSETWKLEQKEDDILPALKLSYDQLPSHLKSCFLICSFYPNDFELSSIELNQIWIAHGLLQSSNERDMEDIGVQYIRELYSRSFLQDLKEVGNVVYFKMHDLVHDLALSISRSECFVVNTHNVKVPDGIRHLSFFENASLDQEVSNFLQKENSLRTLVFPFDIRWPLSESFFNTCISTSKYLRMFKYSNSPLEALPTSIGGLKHLRSLNLSYNKKIKRLPDSIWKLHNLLYLDLSCCSGLEELPKDVRNLIRLRCLYITTKQKYLPDDGIRCLTSLRSLYIWDCPNLEYLIEDIQHLTSMRRLNIMKCRNLISLPRNLMYLNALEVLWIQSCDQFNWTEEDDIEDIRLSLQYLLLHGLPQVVTLPRWLQKSSKTLQLLEISHCENFSSFPEWLQEFTSLEKIEINQCPKLVSLPEGLHHLTTLKTLWIRRCPVLSERCKNLEGEDWHKIAHVPNIYMDDDSDVDIEDSSTI